MSEDWIVAVLMGFGVVVAIVGVFAYLRMAKGAAAGTMKQHLPSQSQHGNPAAGQQQDEEQQGKGAK